MSQTSTRPTVLSTPPSIKDEHRAAKRKCVFTDSQHRKRSRLTSEDCCVARELFPNPAQHHTIVYVAASGRIINSNNVRVE
jgi:hypothetical protein